MRTGGGCVSSGCIQLVQVGMSEDVVIFLYGCDSEFFFFFQKGKIFSNKSYEELMRFGVAGFPAKEIWDSKIPIEVTFHTDIKLHKNC